MVKKVTSIRIEDEILNAFDEKIINKYGETRKYKSMVVENLMKEYIENTPEKNKVKQDKEKQLQKLQNVNQELQKLNKELKNEKQQLIKEKQELEQKNNTLSDRIQTGYRKYNKKFLEMLEEKEKQIEKKENQIGIIRTNYENRINEADKKTIKIQNQYNHTHEHNKKLLAEQSELKEKLFQYQYIIKSINNLSWWDRLLGNYPKEIKELQAPPEKQEKNNE